jgi:hypothetical protein
MVLDAPLAVAVESPSSAISPCDVLVASSVAPPDAVPSSAVLICPSATVGFFSGLALANVFPLALLESVEL